MSYPPSQPPGWYHAQGDPPGTHRWWDGTQWVGGPAVPGGHASPYGGYPQPYGGAYGAYATYGARPDYAGWWSRVGAQILDGLITAVAIIVLVVVGVLAVPTETNVCTDLDDRPYLCDQPTGAGWLLIVGLFVVGLVVTFGYQTYFVGKTGQTLGRKAVGIVVVDRRTGAPIGFGRAFGRFLLAGIFGAACVLLQLLDALWPLWDDEKQTLRDKATNAIVIRARR